MDFASDETQPLPAVHAGNDVTQPLPVLDDTQPPNNDVTQTIPAVQRSRRRWFGAAIVGAVALVALGVNLTASATAADGSLSGRLTDGGAPVPGAWVTLYSSTAAWLASTQADDTGAFAFTDLRPGAYKLSFQAPEFSQWSAQRESFDEADVVQVLGDQTTVVEEVARPHGALSGLVTHPDGTPAVGVAVTVAGPADGTATTDVDGHYTLPRLLTGEYYVQFVADPNGPTQFSPGQVALAQATPVAVVEGAATLDEVLLPTGTITGVLTADDGTPLAGAGVTAAQVADPSVAVFGATDEQGRYTLTAFPGEYVLTFATPTGLVEAPGPVTVTADTSDAAA